MKLNLGKEPPNRQIKSNEDVVIRRDRKSGTMTLRALHTQSSNEHSLELCNKSRSATNGHVLFFQPG